MKRKLFVKQLKMSTANETSAESSSHTAKEQSGSVETPVSTITNQSYTDLDNHSSTAISSMSPASAASLNVSQVSAGRHVLNTAPLPKVDVLMKASLRAFQISDNQSNTYIGKTSLAPPQVESLGEDDQISSQRDVWKKEADADPNVELTPLTANSHFDMDYAQPASYEVHDNSVDVIKRESRDASPVYHQMERPVQPFSEPGIYPHQTSIAPEYIELHSQVNGGPNGVHESSDIIRVHEMGPYSDESSDQDGDHLQEYEHIRAWEQENSRYVDYTWQGDEHQHSTDAVYVKAGSGTDAGILNEDTGSQKAKKNSGKLGGNVKVSGSGSSTRRRRKRVQTPIQRSAANMRERRRMCHLNVAFDHLKDHLPHVKDKKKLSRIQTLKAAIYYIHLLQDSLNTAPRVSEL